MKITITKPELFAAACRFVSTEYARYYLQGVLVRPSPAGGVVMVSTDGHRMFVGYDHAATIEGLPETKDGAPDLIFKPSKRKLTARMFKALELKLDGKAAEFTDSRGSDLIACPFELVNYPVWEKVVPMIDTGADQSPLDECTFDGSYIAEYADLKKSLGADSGLDIFHTGGNPALLGFGRSDCFGVLMPMRNHARAKSPCAAFEARANIFAAQEEPAQMAAE